MNATRIAMIGIPVLLVGGSIAAAAMIFFKKKKDDGGDKNGGGRVARHCQQVAQAYYAQNKEIPSAMTDEGCCPLVYGSADPNKGDPTVQTKLAWLDEANAFKCHTKGFQRLYFDPHFGNTCCPKD